VDVNLKFLGGTALAAIVILLAIKASRARVQAPRRVSCLGDSLTAHGGYCAELQRLLPVGSTVRCFGYEGKGSGYIADRLDDALAWAPTDLVVLAGVNDLASGRGVQRVTDNLEEIFTKARARGVRVHGVGLTPWGRHVRGRDYYQQTQEVNDWLAFHAPVDSFTDTSWLGGAGDLAPEYDSGDGLHMNSEGQRMLGYLIHRKAFA